LVEVLLRATLRYSLVADTTFVATFDDEAFHSLVALDTVGWCVPEAEAVAPLETRQVVATAATARPVRTRRVVCAAEVMNMWGPLPRLGVLAPVDSAPGGGDLSR
jgi:hypothetical protein